MAEKGLPRASRQPLPKPEARSTTTPDATSFDETKKKELVQGDLSFLDEWDLLNTKQSMASTESTMSGSRTSMDTSMDDNQKDASFGSRTSMDYHQIDTSRFEPWARNRGSQAKPLQHEVACYTSLNGITLTQILQLKVLVHALARVRKKDFKSIPFPQLRVLARELVRAGLEKMDAEQMNMHHINDALIIPACRAHGLAKSFAVIINNMSIDPTIFVTHAWNEKYLGFVDSLKSALRHCFEQPVLWICSFALIQGSGIVEEQLQGDIEEMPFVVALKHCKQFLIVRNTETDIYNRMWCVLELAVAMEEDMLSIALVAGPDNFQNEDTSCMHAHASKDEDAKLIRRHLKKKGQKFIDRIDETIRKARTRPDFDRASGGMSRSGGVRQEAPQQRGGERSGCGGVRQEAPQQRGGEGSGCGGVKQKTPKQLGGEISVSGRVRQEAPQQRGCGNSGEAAHGKTLVTRSGQHQQPGPSSPPSRRRQSGLQQLQQSHQQDKRLRFSASLFADLGITGFALASTATVVVFGAGALLFLPTWRWLRASR